MLSGTSLILQGTERARQALLTSVCQAPTGTPPAHPDDRGHAPWSGDENRAACGGNATSAWVAELASRSSLTRLKGQGASSASAEAQPLECAVSRGGPGTECSAESGGVRSLRELMGGKLSGSFLQHVLQEHRGDVAVRCNLPA